MPDDKVKPTAAPVERQKRGDGGAAVSKKRGTRPSFSQQQRREMADYVVELRAEGGLMRYADIIARVRERFGCGFSVAEKALTEAKDRVLESFWRRCRDAPQMIFDGYVEIYQQAMRNDDLGQARKTLDSVRDMFGIRGAVNVNLNLRGMGGDDASGIPSLDDFADLSDVELAALAVLDRARPGILDVPSAEDTMDDVASAGVDAVTAAADDGE